MGALLRSQPLVQLHQEQPQKSQPQNSRTRRELRPPSPAPLLTQTLGDVVVEIAPASTALPQTTNMNNLNIQNISLPNSISIPNIQLLILDAFDNVVAPTITTSNPRHRIIKVFISRSVLSNAIQQILVPLSNNLNQITINDLNNLTIHALMLSGIEI